MTVCQLISPLLLLLVTVVVIFVMALIATKLQELIDSWW